MDELPEVIVRLEESQTFERKKSLSLQREGLESLCGMINADLARGAVLFGVTDDGDPIGVEPGNIDRAQRSLSQSIHANFEPCIQAVIVVLEYQQKTFVLVEASRKRDVPFHEYDGRAFIREGTVTRQMILAEKQSLQRKRNRDSHSGPWKCDRCGMWVGMLGSVEVTDQGPRKSYRCGCGGEFWPAP